MVPATTVSFYCFKCKRTSETDKFSVGAQLKNGCFTVQAECRWCGSRISRIRKSEKGGKGVVNTILNKVPMPEMHMDAEEGETVPGGSFNNKKKYSYCGPFTKLKKRLDEGYQGVNDLDKSCKKHDIDYSEKKDRAARNASDDALALAASRIANDPSKSERERQDARKVVALIGSKSWLKV